MMTPLELVRLPALMALTSGSRDVIVGLLDGPVVTSHPDLASESIREIPGGVPGTCTDVSSIACQHGTFVAGILVAYRASSAPAICPGCSLLVRPIFGETRAQGEYMPNATSQQLALAIYECIDAGVQVLNFSAAMEKTSITGDRELQDALDYALRRNTIVVAAVGNQGTVGSSAITRHPWVIPVVGYGIYSRPMAQSNLGSSIGKRGLGAPGEGVTSLCPEGEPLTLAGTSLAAAFVSGAIALLWSQFPSATAAHIKSAVTSAPGQRRTSVVPPLLDAWGAYQRLSGTYRKG
jgi:subtilisin family serine protease